MSKRSIHYPVTYSLILIQLFVFCLVCLSEEWQQTILYYGSAYHEWILDGELWRLFTAVFIHSASSHLCYNLFTLFLIGIFMESILPAKHTLLTFLLSGIASNATTLLFTDNFFLHYGSSSAVAGLLGCLTIMILKNRTPLPTFVVWIVLFGFGFHTFTSLLSFQINTIGHFLGFICGGILAFILHSK